MIALAFLIPVAVLVALVAGIAALAKRNDEEPEGGLARRIVVSFLTFGLTVTLAVGIYLLADLATEPGTGIARTGSGDIARALALVIVSGPSAFLLWRYQLRALAGPDGRSIVWLLHMTLAALVFSIGTVVALGNGIRFDGYDSAARTSLMFGLAWLATWVFHEWVAARRPVPLLPGLPRAVGSAVGLVTASAGLISLVDALTEEIVADSVVAASGDAIVEAIVWTVLGLAVWGWQFLAGRPTERDMARTGLIQVVGIGGGTLLGVTGLTGLLTIALSAITTVADLGDLGGVIGATLVGFLVWRYHWSLLDTPRQTRIARHIVSGVSLVGLATGIGILVAEGVAATTPVFFVRNDVLLWGGVAAVLVGGPVWWASWRPERHPHPDAGSPEQLTYLTVLFGIAGVAGAIGLVYLVYQLLEGVLDGDRIGAIVDAVSNPLGFVVATGLVAAYHYRRWVETRVEHAEPEPMSLERLIVVGPSEAAEDLREELGVRVTGWRSAGEGRVLPREELASHLRTLDATDALVVEEDRGYRVIRLVRGAAQRPQSGEPQA